MVSEVFGNEIRTDNRKQSFDINIGCAGLAFKTKEPIFEPCAQSSQLVSKQEIDPNIIGITVNTIIAAPIFDELGNSMGVFEVINCDKSNFTSHSIQSTIKKFSKYVSLLFYTNILLKV